jgi:glyoxylase-like metal-dependent hydrolase (beta-lactamase superfamily II)
MRVFEVAPSLVAALAAVVELTALSLGQQPQSSRASASRDTKALRLYVFDCGTLKADPARFRLERTEVATTNLSVPCFLVVHPKGRLMWDVGAVPDEDWRPTGKPVAHHVVLPDGSERALTLRKRLLPQLAEAGYRAADITFLALSHYHYDHTANANAFARATWLVRGVERDAMFADRPPAITQPSSYAALKNSVAMIIEGWDYDVFGDQTVLIKLAPGHTPGHQVLYVKLTKTGGVVLSGDLYHFPEARTLKRVTVFDYDQQLTLLGRRAIEQFLVSSGAQLWIQHDDIGNRKLRKSPQYYE